MPRATYFKPETGRLEAFFDGAFAEVHEHSKKAGLPVGVLDSATTGDVTKDMLANLSGDTTRSKLPPEVANVIAKMPKDHAHRVLDGVLTGMNIYRREHGCLPTADLIEAALQQGVACAYTLGKDGRGLLDSAGNAIPNHILDGTGGSEHSDPQSAFPNRIVVAILSALAEAVPFATYLPADIGSNESRLGIVSHQAGTTFGAYNQGDLMDGVNIGKPYLGAERRITLTMAGDGSGATGQFTTTVGGETGLTVLRGRTIIFVNGMPSAMELPNTPASIANSPIAGTATVGGSQYGISGYVTTATGAVSVTFTPDLPSDGSGVVVESEGYIDYEAQPSLSPEMVSQVQTYTLYASPWRARARQTIDSKTQYNNEIGLDLQSETLIAIRNQFANERHYNALNKCMSIANGLKQYTFDFAISTQIGHKMRSQIWQDAMAVMGQADQDMANNTMDHGITHYYVSKNVAAQFRGLPAEIWEPSGITARPGIYRLGRLFGIYDIYYSPRVVSDSSDNTTSVMLGVGRSTQAARCPIVMGDAVPPTYMPLAFGDDFRYGQGFYARNYTAVNPHTPSAMGAAIINITNLFNNSLG